MKVYHASRRLYSWIILWVISQLFFFDLIEPTAIWGLLGGRTPLRLIFVMLVVAFCLRLTSGTVKRQPMDAIVWLMIIFTAVSTVSWFLADPDAGQENLKWLTTLLNLTVFPFTAYYIVKNLPYDRRLVRKFVAFLCLLGIYLAITGIAEHYRVWLLVWPGYILDPDFGTHWGRARGPFGSSVTMGRLLTFTILSMLMMVTVWHGARKKVLYMAIVLGIAAIYFTYTRGPWLGFFMALVVVAGLGSHHLRRRSLLVFFLIALGALSGIGSKFSIFGDDTLFSRRQKTVDGRLVNWITSGKMFLSNPITGIGYGRYEEEWGRYFKDVKGLEFGGFDGNHNAFLAILSETGLLGFLPYALMMGLLMLQCWRVYRRIRADCLEKKLVILVFGSAASYLATSLFSDVRFHPMPSTILFVLFGIVASLKIRLDSGGDEFLHEDKEAQGGVRSRTAWRKPSVSPRIRPGFASDEGLG